MPRQCQHTLKFNKSKNKIPSVPVYGFNFLDKNVLFLASKHLFFLIVTINGNYVKRVGGRSQTVTFSSEKDFPVIFGHNLD